jgi:hypothetical protein
MGLLRGVVVGVVGLSALEVAVSSDVAAGRVGGLLDGAAGAVRWFVSTDVAGVPERAGCFDSSNKPRKG